MDDTDLAAERAAAILWARDLLRREDFVILDTETTGLDDDAEVCQVGVLSPQGVVHLDTYVRPQTPIPAGATAIHGITNAMVELAPEFTRVGLMLRDLIGHCDVVVYNLSFDSRVLWQSGKAVGLPWRLMPEHCHCAMEEYARFVGDWSDYHGSFRWQKLPPVPGETAHGAIGDCRATLALIKRMAEAKIEGE